MKQCADLMAVIIFAFCLLQTPGIALQPMHKVASGGELSRIGLTLQLLVQQQSAVATLIFDEVDTGISGATAEVVGQMLRKIAPASTNFLYYSLATSCKLGAPPITGSETSRTTTNHFPYPSTDAARKTTRNRSFACRNKDHAKCFR